MNGSAGHASYNSIQLCINDIYVQMTVHAQSSFLKVTHRSVGPGVKFY